MQPDAGGDGAREDWGEVGDRVVQVEVFIKGLAEFVRLLLLLLLLLGLTLGLIGDGWVTAKVVGG